MENNGKGIFYGVIGVATLIVAIIGATFAFFTAANSNDGTITGTAATAGLDLAVARVEDYANGEMIPQPTAGIGTATSATNKCIDGNRNTVCKVYKVTVTNKGNSSVTIAGKLTFTATEGAAYANLMWGKSDTVTGFTATNSANVALGSAPVTDILLDSKASGASVGTVQLGATGSGTETDEFYIVVYINEANTAQDTIDKGTFTGKVEFNASSADGTAVSGVTSTFTA